VEIVLYDHEIVYFLADRDFLIAIRLSKMSRRSPKKNCAVAVDARDLETDTLANNSYRKVAHTVPDQFQLVLMSLNDNENIPREIHRNTVQFIRVESGQARVTINDTDVYELSDGNSITIPPNNFHFVENITPGARKVDRKLKLYTIYTPPEHPPTRHQLRQPKTR
jgi:mannose-6-phosphate isomerase-like protein (cupin superfamily)